MRWVPAYVALGSNLAGPERQVEDAFARLAQLPDSRLLARSRLYGARPLGPQDQPDFINAVAGLLTRLPAPELLAQLQAIERSMGREMPERRWGPRLIDLDLLVYSTTATASTSAAGSSTATEHADELVLPHPGIHERNFVLYPLAEIAPELHIPGRGQVAELARRVGSDGLRLLRMRE